MKRFEIYENYGVLGAEKRSVYTYGGEHPQATYSEKIAVTLPQNENFRLYETTTGELAVQSAWGWTYSIDEVLQGNKVPCFLHWIRIKMDIGFILTSASSSGSPAGLSFLHFQRVKYAWYTGL